MRDKPDQQPHGVARAPTDSAHDGGGSQSRPPAPPSTSTVAGRQLGAEGHHTRFSIPGRHLFPSLHTRMTPSDRAHCYSLPGCTWRRSARGGPSAPKRTSRGGWCNGPVCGHTRASWVPVTPPSPAPHPAPLPPVHLKPSSLRSLSSPHRAILCAGQRAGREDRAKHAPGQQGHEEAKESHTVCHVAQGRHAEAKGPCAGDGVGGTGRPAAAVPPWAGRAAHKDPRREGGPKPARIAPPEPELSPVSPDPHFRRPTAHTATSRCLFLACSSAPRSGNSPPRHAGTQERPEPTPWLSARRRRHFPYSGAT